MTVSDDERLARLALARVAEPGARDIHAALQGTSAVEVWAAVLAGAPLGQLGQRALEGMAGRASRTEPERDLQRLRDLGGRVVCPGDDEWPDGLDWQPDDIGGNVKQMAPPWVLLVRGEHSLREVCATSVAIVGARAATAYGSQLAGDLAFALSEAGVAVVSGGAYGIDGDAHRGALSAGATPTVAVLACGPDIAYPRGHDRLLSEIARTGLVVSEVPPGCAPTRVRFLVRNRLVAGLTQGTVVVEAAARSGSLSTAARAVDLNRHLMAVPGPATSVQSTGCHELIRSGKAVLVQNAFEVLEVVSPAGVHLLTPPKGAIRPRDSLSEQTKRVLDAIPVRNAVGVARVAATAGVSALVVQMVLPELLLAGLVEQRDGAWRLTTLGAS